MGLPPRTGSGSLVPGVLRWLPVLVAGVIALVEVMTLGGIYVSDTGVFIRHTLHATPFGSDCFNVVPPTYPLLLDGVWSLAPPSVRMFLLVLVQQASVVWSVHLVLRIGEVVQRPWLGWCAASLTALHLPFGLLAQTGQTETLFIFFCVTSSFLLIKGLTAGRTALVLAGGALAGMAIAQRTVGIAVPVAALAAMWLSSGPGRVKATVAFVLGFGAVIGLFIVKNQQQYGRTNLVSGTGIHLFGRVAMIERSAPETPETAFLREVAKAEGWEIFHANAGWSFHVVLVSKHGHSHEAADALLRTAALQSFSADPWRTAVLTISAMRSIAAPSDPFIENLGGSGALGAALRPAGYHAFFEEVRSVWAGSAEFHQLVSRLPPYPPPLILGEWPFSIMESWARLARVWRGDWTLVAMTIAGIIGLLLRNRAVILFSALALGLLVAAAAGDQPVPRYFEPAVIPFFLALLLAPAEVFARLRAAGQAEAGIDHEAERGAAVEPELGPSPDPGTGS